MVSQAITNYLHTNISWQRGVVVSITTVLIGFMYYWILSETMGPNGDILIIFYMLLPVVTTASLVTDEETFLWRSFFASSLAGALYVFLNFIAGIGISLIAAVLASFLLMFFVKDIWFKS